MLHVLFNFLQNGSAALPAVEGEAKPSQVRRVREFRCGFQSSGLIRPRLGEIYVLVHPC